MSSFGSVTTTVPNGTCLLHGAYAGGACPVCCTCAPYPARPLTQHGFPWTHPERPTWRIGKRLPERD